jgi:hypothetical protein
MHGELANTSDERVIRNLANVHVAIGIAAAIAARIDLPPTVGLPHILVAPLIASAMCQAVLLALWVVNSTASPFVRLGALAGGVVYVEALVANIVTGELFGIGITTLAATSLSLLVLRRLGIVLVRRVDSNRPDPDATAGLRFSIRSLMIVTAAVAILIAGAQALRAGPTGPRRVNPVLGLCFTAVGLVALWAGLGHARPFLRGPVLILLALSLGVFFAIAANAHRAGWIYVLLTMLLFSTGLLASLSLIRACGYRYGKMHT